MSPYLYALASNFCFGLGAQVFTKFSRMMSPVWMTVFKGAAAFVFFGAAILLTGGFHAIELRYMLTFMLSGFLAFGFGDMLMLKAFADMGPGRTMMLFAFQPLILGVMSYFLFGQTVNAVKFVSIIFFIICMFVFALESYRRHGHWSLLSMLIAFGAMFMDAVGILITRYSFDGSNALPMEGNFYRTAGALVSFIIVCSIFKVNFFKKLKSMTGKQFSLAGAGCFVGTFLCLLFYLTAIKTGHLASLSSIALTGVLFAAFFECLFERKLPSKYFMVAAVFFAMGMYLLLGYN
ncbi:drug/metabolite transporter (DMT)-like permease [Elusimicrobium simillimum]|uniref:EamA family transporter n=1 Tax=Elusimicrobium simillimum TaxID=3143438 RepID=UPI003C6F9C7A